MSQELLQCTNAQHSLRNNSGIPDTSQIHINKYTEAKKHDIKGAENVCVSRNKIFPAFKLGFIFVTKFFFCYSICKVQ